MKQKTKKQAREYYESIQDSDVRDALQSEFDLVGNEKGDTRESQFYSWVAKYKM